MDSHNSGNLVTIRNMKKLLFFLLIVSGVAQAQVLWEVNPKAVPNEIGGVDSVKYLSGRVINAEISQGVNSKFEFYIAFHRPDGTILRGRNLSQSSYTQNLMDKGTPQQQAEVAAEYVWANVIPDLFGKSIPAKTAAVVALLNVYGYTLKE